MSHPGVVIAGGGLAAQRCAETLRSQGFEGRIRVVCAESVPPYDRPPLSKGYLLGDVTGDKLAHRPHRWYETAAVELLLGESAAGLELSERRLLLAGGGALAFDQLLIATGSEPRRLPVADGFANVHYLRTLVDAHRLRGAFRASGRIAVIGAGFIGQEVAATARAAGLEVTLVEALPAPLHGILGKDLGRWFARFHADHGVDLELGVGVDRLRGSGWAKELLLTDGRTVSCDAVVVGIGVAPAASWLRGSGLPDGGVPVGPAGRTALPGVFAAGDVALRRDPRSGHRVRSEHWEAAARQGAQVGRAMLGLDAAPEAPASFWSDQYGVRIQCVGDPSAADAVRIEGEPEAADFSAVFTRRGRPIAVLLVGRPRELARARRLLAEPDVESIREVSRAA